LGHSERSSPPLPATITLQRVLPFLCWWPPAICGRCRARIFAECAGRWLREEG
jgi:hypothetical protein